MIGGQGVKKFVNKVIILLLITSVWIGAYCEIATVSSLKYQGPNTAEQIKMSFENSVKVEYDCYFLGNSRVYRGINPDKITSVNSYNFAHNNDSYNQMYYKLLYLLNAGKQIDCLIIGTVLRKPPMKGIIAIIVKKKACYHMKVLPITFI